MNYYLCAKSVFSLQTPNEYKPLKWSIWNWNWTLRQSSIFDPRSTGAHTSPRQKKLYLKAKKLILLSEDEKHTPDNIGRKNHLQHAWDEVAPLNEDQEAIDEVLQMDDDAAEPFDIGQDLGLPSQVDNVQSITVLSDEEHRKQIRTLNKKQVILWMSYIMLKFQMNQYVDFFVWLWWSWKDPCHGVTLPNTVQISKLEIWNGPYQRMYPLDTSDCHILSEEALRILLWPCWEYVKIYWARHWFEICNILRFEMYWARHVFWEWEDVSVAGFWGTLEKITMNTRKVVYCI